MTVQRIRGGEALAAYFARIEVLHDEGGLAAARDALRADHHFARLPMAEVGDESESASLRQTAARGDQRHVICVTSAQCFCCARI